MERRNYFLVLVLLLAVGILVTAVLWRGGGDARPAPAGLGDAAAAEPESAERRGVPVAERGGALASDDGGSRSEVAAPSLAPATVALRGRLVRAADRAPVAGVGLGWEPFDAEGPARDPDDAATIGGKTAGDGSFELRIPTGRRGLLAIEHDANLLFETGERRRMELAGRDSDADLGTLATVPTSTIAGRVLDEQGRPVTSARVRANPDALILLLPGQGQEVDEQGRFELTGLEPGRHNLVAEAAGRVPAIERVDLKAGASARDLVLTLARGASVAGTVLDDRGLPVADAKVASYRNRSLAGNIEISGVDAGGAVTTDANGYFALSGIEGERVTLRAWRDGFAPATARDIAIGTGNVTMRLARLGRIAGVLLDTEGRPIEGSRVVARAFGGGPAVVESGPDMLPFGRDARTDAEGRFEIDGVRPGTVSIQATGESHLPVEGTNVQVLAGVTVENVTLRAEVGAGVAALVVDPDGAPVPGATVVVSTPAEAAPMAAQDGARRVAVRTRGGRAEGRLASFAAPRELRRGTTGADGRVRIGGLPTGPVAVHGEHDRHAPSPPAELTVPRSGTVEAVLTLRPAGHAEVRSLTTAGEPAPEVGFVIRGPLGAPEAERVTRTGTTDGSGVARVGPLLTGRYEAKVEFAAAPMALTGDVRVMISGSAGDEIEESRVEFEIVAGAATEVVLRRPVLATVAGTVRGAGGPAAGVEVTLRGEGALPFGPMARASTDADGRFTLRDIVPGTYELEWGKPGRLVMQRERLEVPAGTEELRHDLELRGGSVQVRVHSATTGAPLAGAEVSLRRPSDSGRPQRTMMLAVRTSTSDDGESSGASSIRMGGPSKVTTDADGMATIPDVPPGTYEALVEHPEHANGSAKDVEVLDGRLTDAGVVRLESAGALRGTVSGFPDGTDLRIATIEIRKAGSDERPRRETAMNGTFQVGSLVPGDYELRAQRVGPGADGTHGPWQPVTVRAGETAQVELPLGG